MAIYLWSDHSPRSPHTHTHWWTGVCENTDTITSVTLSWQRGCVANPQQVPPSTAGAPAFTCACEGPVHSSNIRRDQVCKSLVYCTLKAQLKAETRESCTKH